MDKYRVWFLILILAIAVFFRLWQIGTIPPGLYPDEAMNGNNALEALHTGEYKVFYPENNGREGLYINIVALSLKIFGNEPWALRLVSALFGILTVLGLYFLTKELFKKESIALFASFFLAASFWHIMFSRIGFRAIMAPAFLVWSLFFLFLALRKNNFTYSILSGLLFGLGFHSYIAYRAAPLLLIPSFLVFLKRKSFKPILIFLIAAFIAVLPLLIFFAQNPQDFLGRTSQISVFSSDNPVLDLAKNTLKTIGMFFWQGDFNWRHNYAGAPELWWPVAILFLIGIIISIKNLPARNASHSDAGGRVTRYSLLVTWFVVMLLPVVISNEGLPHALRAIIVAPVAMIFAALGLDWLIEKIRKWLNLQIIKYPESVKQLLRIKKEAVALLFVFFTVIIIHTFIFYFFEWAYNSNTQGAFNSLDVEKARYLNSLPKDTPKYVIIQAGGVDVRGIPMPSQTVMFITKTFLPEWQKEKNIHYIFPEEENNVPENAKRVWIR
ncbi:glycosyltransferase family 39 protein [Patescibacteria group bacterium]|nr:glycosyltransferase family 39 protein [Patescibacteria group bacterium]